MSTTENLDNKIKEFWPKNGPPTQEIEKYVKKYSKEKIVIKCGGRVLLDPDLFNNFINDIIILKKLGLTPIVVHGGGPRIKKKLDELTDAQLQYCSNDVIYLHKVRDELHKMLVRENRLELYNSSIEFLKTRIKLDQSGFTEDIFQH